jgi:indole-3-glycerol phosphate synthase
MPEYGANAMPDEPRAPGARKDILKEARDESTRLIAQKGKHTESMQEAAARASPVRPFEDALMGTEQGIKLICEIKKSSPSAGLIRRDFDPVRIAKAYEVGGATALSVLTNATHFEGSLDHLMAARGAVSLPVLRKDFIIGPYQIWESRAAGADAILLIVRMLTDEELIDLMAATAASRMTALVEVHDERELERAMKAGATVIGVNSRDLRTLQIDMDLCIRLANLLPKGSLCVAESGISTRDDLLRIEDAGYHAALIGETFMRQYDIVAAVREMLGRAVTGRTAVVITDDEPEE